MLHINPRIVELLSLPFYSRILGAWGRKPRRPMVLPDEQGCLVFQGATNSKGYGCVGEGLVHRLAWESYFGPIPEGWEIHHKCRNKLCCNVDHLECMSKVDHAELEGRGQKLNEDAVREMLVMLSNGASRAVVASAYGVSLTTVTEIRRGRAWKRVVAEYYERDSGQLNVRVA